MKTSKMYLNYMASCRFGDKIWFVNGCFNGLFSLDVIHLSLEFKHKIPFLPADSQLAYGNIQCSYGNKIFFFPNFCKQIMIYDVVMDDIQAMSLEPEDGTETYMTMGIVQWNERLWIFPSRLEQGIFIMDLNTLQLELDDDLCRMLASENYNIYSQNNLIQVNDTEIAILLSGNSIAWIDIQTKQLRKKKHFKESVNFWGIKYYKGNYWLLPSDSTDIYEWNQAEDKLIKYQLQEEEWISDRGLPYSNIIFVEDQVILLPFNLKYIMKIDRETYKISKAIDYPKGFRFLNHMSAWTAFAAYDLIGQSRFVLHPSQGNMLLIYDIEKNTLEGRKLTVDCAEVSYLNEIFKERFRRNDGIIYENDALGVEKLDFAVDVNHFKIETAATKGIGQKIYNAVIM